MSDRVNLTVTKRTDPQLLEAMGRHYSQPKGFVGRSIAYSIEYDGHYYGHIVAGSATRFLPGRHGFLGTTSLQLNSIVNNVFFHVEKRNGRYPIRNFVSRTLSAWRSRVERDWEEKYGDSVVGFETLIELPRTGEAYRRDGWVCVGKTKGFTCKRVAGQGTDSWTGKRVWNITDLRPKWVFCHRSEKMQTVQLPTLIAV